MERSREADSLTPADRQWWRDAVIYQVYLRSFADDNGDGTGDIAGLRSRLPYLESLGVDGIWINPWYESPFNDGGYDVADYRSIHPRFGTLEEAKSLIEEARDNNLRLLVDLVPNHTSSEHAWFRGALASPPGSPERARYHFSPGRGEDGSIPPSDWRSVFGGPAWSRVPDGEWYLHLFDVTQPDLNWANREVREEFDEIIRFWLDLGVDGFRVDVAHALAKDPEYPDVGEEVEELLATPDSLDHHPFWDRPELHEIVRGWRSVLEEYESTVMVAEAWLPSWERMSRYLRPGEYHQAFDFLFLQSPWDPDEMRRAVSEALSHSASVGSIPTWVLSNHDVVRHATRFALPNDVDAREWLLDGDRSLLDERRGLRRARAASLLMLALPGSAYLYQGEELGLPEVHDLPSEVLQDPVWEDSGHTHKGRDGCRVPLPWARTGASLGFGSNGPWLPQPPWWDDLSVEAQDGVDGSTLELYRRALGLRRHHLRGSDRLEWVDVAPGVLAFTRANGFACWVNFGDGTVAMPPGRLILSSGDLPGDGLPGETAVWVQLDHQE